MAEGIHNEFKGEAGSLLQAGKIYGDVYVGTRPARPRTPNQLSAKAAHYVNNERQLKRLDTILRPESAEGGLRTALIGGAPGSGRTALATEWCHRHQSVYPDGLFYTRLGGAGSAKAALADMLTAVGYGRDAIPSSVDGRAAMWRTWSSEKRLAVIIDDALRSAEAEPLLPTGPGSAALVVQVGSLTQLQARHSAKHVRLEPLSEEAARSLLERALESDKVAAEPEAVTGLVRFCGGSATALNVAVALIDEFDWPVSRLVRQLERKGPLAELALAAMFDTAYERLEPLARRCYRAIGAHPGADPVGVGALAAAVSAEDLAEPMRELVRASLVQEEDDERYRLGGLIAEHAAAKAAEEDGPRLTEALLIHYRMRGLACAEAVKPGRGWAEALWPSLGRFEPVPKEEALRWLEVERGNLAAAVAAAEDPEVVVQLCLALWPVHETGEYSTEMVAVNGLGVQAAQVWGDDLARAVLGIQLGFGHRQLRNWPRAIEAFDKAREAAERAGSLEAQATVEESTGLIRIDEGAEDEARRLLQRNLRLAERIGVARRIAMAKFHLAKVSEPDSALALLDAARAEFAEDAANLRKVDLWRGIKLGEQGNRAAAEELLRTVVREAEAAKQHREHARAWEELAKLADRAGETAAARENWEKALEIWQLRGFTAEAAAVLERLSAAG
ncbi:hypothetical protein [Amycolatopsis sp. CA-230715]|uniref:hypothetical protein n=1 Tax=Amycolatopsis sp. CA-230715 TaxID=2745196 RepID=UPI001C013D32|nr:hypothetical protein [Amycolatopsis sp. CA-230715]QWF82705.1 Regulatory protein AfsR [Amycolatopsis sp. CA-230715]